jgi:hypothetical protein
MLVSTENVTPIGEIEAADAGRWRAPSQLLVRRSTPASEPAPVSACRCRVDDDRGYFKQPSEFRVHKHRRTERCAPA